MIETGLSTDMLLLTILAALTLISYMIAINSHGAARMSLSYLLATILLAVTIFAVLQQVNSRVAKQQEKIYSQKVQAAEKSGAQNARLEVAKEQKSKEVASQKELSAQTDAEIKRITPYIVRAQRLAKQVKGTKLQGYGKSYDQLTSKASSTLSSVNREKKKFKKLSIKNSSEAQRLMNRGYDKLSNAARYYTLYYRADNTGQEVEREQVMRRNAAEAQTLFDQASATLEK